MIENFPLSWPADWPRTLPQKRTRAKFGKASGFGVRKITTAEAAERCIAELKRIGVGNWNVIVSTNVQSNRKGLPYSDMPEPKDPGAAVYWTPRGNDAGVDRKVMAIDKYDRVADNLAAIAATLEAMRAIERHGGGQILERVFTGFTALPSPDGSPVKRDWRTVLDLRTASGVDMALVKSSYRQLASKHHPDRPGGSHEKMTELNQALKEAEEALS